MIPKISSSHGSETRNLINRLIDVVNKQGKSIQDLVAEGQLTEEQYADLLTSINGLVKSGQVDKSDLTPEFKDEIEGFNAQLAQIVTVIKPTGTDNDSLNINNSLSGGNGKFLIKKGEYNIEDDILVQSNSVLEFEEGAIFKKVPTNSDSYNVLLLDGVDNVTLINPQIVGDKYSHTGTTGEWGHGISLKGTKNIKIQNPNIKECWGDGIYLGVVFNSDIYSRFRYCTDTWINDAICDDNRRNGLTITSVKGLSVKNSQFNNSKGTDPQAGIDIEPNSDDNVLEDIFLDNILLKNNGMRGVFFCLWLLYGDEGNSPFKNVSITLNNVKVEGSVSGFETLLSNFTDSSNPAGTNRTAIKNLNGTITLNNCETRNNGGNSVRLYRWFDAGLKIIFNNLKAINPNTEKGTSSAHHSGISLYDPNNSTTPPEYRLGGVEFNDLELIHANDDPLKRSVYVTDTTNKNPATTFILRNPKKMDGRVRFAHGLDDATGLIIDNNKVLKLYTSDTQRPIDQYEPYYSVVSNINTTTDKTLTINAPDMHYEEITFVNENSFTFTIQANSSQRFFPSNTQLCVLEGYGSKVTVKRIDDLKWEVVNVVNGSFV